MKKSSKFEDTPKTQGLRNKLVTIVREKGIKDERVLSALQKVPRHYFLDNAFLAQAYSDHAFQIGSGQTISQPYTVAFQTELLEVKKGDKVLEIGTGSGYQTCVLVELGAKVFSIERQKELYDKAKKILPEIGYSTAKLYYGDGYKGIPAFAPYDKVLVTCAAPEIPAELLKQLKVGGIMVIPVGPGNVQKMIRLYKTSEEGYSIEEHKEFRFVPMLTDKNWGAQ